MKQQGTITTLARHLVVLLKPFVNTVASPDNFRQFMFRLGWNVNNIPPAFSNLGVSVNLSLSKLELLGDDPPIEDALGLLNDVKSVFDKMANLGPADVPAGVDPAAFLSEIKNGLFEALLVDYLIEKYPIGFNFLRTTGIIDEEFTDVSVGRPAFFRIRFNWNKFTDLIEKPGGIPQQ